jgi:hypothetical protein
MRYSKREMGGKLTWQTATLQEEERDKLPNCSCVLLPPPSPILLSLSIHATAQGKAAENIICNFSANVTPPLPPPLPFSILPLTTTRTLPADETAAAALTYCDE